MTALAEAVALVEDARIWRMIAGDHDTAARLAELVRHLKEEDDYLDGLERFNLPRTDRRYPPGKCLGWLFAVDPHVRKMRDLRGLSNPSGGLL